MNVVILAAGMGKRMHSRLPKVLQPLAGKAMLDHVLKATEQFAEHPRVVVLGHAAQMVRERYAQRSDVSFAYQAEQRGTGDALKQALSSLNVSDPRVLVCLGDVPLLTQETLTRMEAASAEADLVLLTVHLRDPKGYGRIVRDDAGRIKAIVEEKDADAEQKLITEVNTGIMCLPTARLACWLNELTNDNAQGEYYLTDVVAFAADEGLNISSVHPDFPWEVAGVNSKEQLAELERTWQRVQANRLLQAGTTLIDPDRIDIRGELICGQDVEIDVNVVFEGAVRIGNNVRIGANCVVKDSVIGDDTEILPFCHIDGADVGGNSRIGPYSRLRPGAHLTGSNHVGNFVEIKKSDVGEFSKVNHLTYIGDADVGSRVNIGAGTITCNYDGVNKFRTKIGDDAFIGSGTELVAPVEIGSGSTVGAGTTVTRNVPDGKLVVGRVRQKVVEGWQRPQKKIEI